MHSQTQSALLKWLKSGLKTELERSFKEETRKQLKNEAGLRAVICELIRDWLSENAKHLAVREESTVYMPGIGKKPRPDIEIYEPVAQASNCVEKFLNREIIAFGEVKLSERTSALVNLEREAAGLLEQKGPWRRRDFKADSKPFVKDYIYLRCLGDLTSWSVRTPKKGQKTADTNACVPVRFLIYCARDDHKDSFEKLRKLVSTREYGGEGPVPPRKDPEPRVSIIHVKVPAKQR